MKRFLTVTNLLFVVLLVTVCIPEKKEVETATAFLVVILMVQGYYIYRLIRKTEVRMVSDIIFVVYSLLLVWELLTTKLGIAHKILVPSPEDVFHVFVTQRKLMVTGLFSSLQLLAIGFAFALTFGVGLGLIVGWIPRLRKMFFPIAKVISPIPPVIYTPYVVALMPTFRSASALVITLGIFWPTFMGTINRVGGIEPRILDSARVLHVGTGRMITKILLPYVLPSVISGLHVSLSTSFMILTIAEMMGASSGLGYFIKNFSDYANYTNVVAGIILVGIVVTMLNQFINLLEKHCIRWRT